jgi:signal transduction histidine kinase
MELAERKKCLASLDLFAAIPDQDLVRLAANLKEIFCQSGTVLCQEGDPGTEMFILLRGALRVFKEQRTIAVITPVDYIGEMALVETKPRSASVQTLEDSSLLVIPSEEFRFFLAKQPQFLIGLTQVLSQRVRRDTEILAEEFEKANILVHDMRNILSIFLLLPKVRKEVSSKLAREQITMMMQARDNLAAMMEEALANAKRMQYRPPVGKCSLPELVAGIIASASEVHSDLHDKEIALSVKGTIPDFCFNALEIRRVLLNLLINAGQASAEGAQIEVTMKAGSEFANISVRDYGQGIGEEVKKKIFQPHFTTKPDGTGLGLVSCKKIIEEHHGGILNYESPLGKGTVFSFTLPYRKGCDGSETKKG